MTLDVPARHNIKLQQLVERINTETELRQLWNCVNINAVERRDICNHGEIRIRIVANAALRIQRLLIEAGIEPSVVTHHQLTPDETEVIVVLTACLYDPGIAIHRDDHERYNLILAYPRLANCWPKGLRDPDNYPVS